jgi:hypothetical protein
MPKGRPRDVKDRVLTIDEQIKALKDKKADMLRDDADKAKRLFLRRCFLIGETILDAKLSHEEKAVICGIMSRRESKPKDWDKVSDFTVHLVREAPSIKPAASEFTRTGK